MKNTEATLHWIVGVLRKHGVPFVISGGFAAKIYGSARPLNDIDIDIPEAAFPLILADIAPFAVFGPARFVNARWDLLLATLDHNGQLIDLSGAETCRICDNRDGIWRDMPADLDTFEMQRVYGLDVPVMGRGELAAYKMMLAGDHQIVDVEAVKASMR